MLKNELLSEEEIVLDKIVQLVKKARITPGSIDKDLETYDEIVDTLKEVNYI